MSTATMNRPASDTVTPTQWTVMVFMGTDTEEGNAQMLQPAIEDLREMAAVGSSDSLKIYAQVHTRDAVYSGKIDASMFDAFRAQGLSALPAKKKEPLRFGSPGPLAEFLWTSLKDAGHQAGNPQHCSMLVLWGHAYDFAIGKAPARDGEVEALDFVEIAETLHAMQREVGEMLQWRPNPKLDVVAFDACDVATAEVAYQLEPFADYLLASEGGVPLPGWPYADVLERLAAPHGRLMRPVELGQWIVNRYCESYAPRNRAATLSMLNLSRAGDLSDCVAALTHVLRGFIAGDAAKRGLIAGIFLRSMTESDKPYVDVADLCLGLAREAGDPMVSAAAHTLGDFLVAPFFFDVGAGDAGQLRPFITAHGRTAGETAKLNGLSIYAPHLVPERDSRSLRNLYGRFSFSELTGWPTVVYELANDALEATGN